MRRERMLWYMLVTWVLLLVWGTIDFSASQQRRYHEVAAPAGNVTLDNAQFTNNDVITSSVTYSNFTVANNPNRLLIVALSHFHDTNTMTGESCTFGGIAVDDQTLTLDHASGNVAQRIFIEVAPAVSTGDVVCSWTGNGRSVLLVHAYYNVDQTTPIGVTGQNTGASNQGPTSVNLLGTPANVYTMDVLSRRRAGGGYPMVPTAPQVELAQDRSGTGGANAGASGSSTQDSGAGGTIPFAWTWPIDVNADWVAQALVLNAN